MMPLRLILKLAIRATKIGLLATWRTRLLNDTPEVRAYITRAENEIIKTLQLNRGVLIKRAMEIALGQTEESLLLFNGTVIKSRR